MLGVFSPFIRYDSSLESCHTAGGMTMGSAVLIGFISLLAGGFFGWLLARSQAAGMHQRVRDLKEQLDLATTELKTQAASNSGLRETVVQVQSDLAHERAASAEKLELVSRAKDELSAAFKALSAEALKS